MYSWDFDNDGNIDLWGYSQSWSDILLVGTKETKKLLLQLQMEMEALTLPLSWHWIVVKILFLFIKGHPPVLKEQYGHCQWVHLYTYHSLDASALDFRAL